MNKFAILFTGNNCAGCKPMKEKISKLKSKFSEIEFTSYNVDDEDVMEKLMLYNVRSIPCLILKRNTSVVDVIIGDIPEDKLINILEEL